MASCLSLCIQGPFGLDAKTVLLPGEAERNGALDGTTADGGTRDGGPDVFVGIREANVSR